MIAKIEFLGIGAVCALKKKIFGLVETKAKWGWIKDAANALGGAIMDGVNWAKNGIVAAYQAVKDAVSPKWCGVWSTTFTKFIAM